MPALLLPLSGRHAQVGRRGRHPAGTKQRRKQLSARGLWKLTQEARPAEDARAAARARRGHGGQRARRGHDGQRAKAERERAERNGGRWHTAKPDRLDLDDRGGARPERDRERGD